MAVTIYGTPSCMQCGATKTWLKNHGVLFSEIDITTDEDAERLVMESGIRTLPLVEAEVGGKKETWGGFQPQRLKRLAQ